LLRTPARLEGEAIEIRIAADRMGISLVKRTLIGNSVELEKAYATLDR